MCHNDQKTLPGLPVAHPSATLAESPVNFGETELFNVVAAQAVASALLDSLVVYSPSFCGASLENRSLAVLRFVAATLDAMPGAENYREISVVRDRLDSFLFGGLV